MSIGLTIQSDDLNEMIASAEELGAAMSGRDILTLIGTGMREVIMDHFAQLDQDAAHHRSAQALGAAPTGFYAKARSHTHEAELESGGVSVSIEQEGLRQRLFGGTIEAPPGKLLTIPARTETYGHRAREFANLRLIMFGPDRGALVEREATVLRGGARGASGGFKSVAGLGGRRKGESLGGLVYYWLVKQVTQDPDPTVLPTDEAILDPALENARNYIERLWSRS